MNLPSYSWIIIFFLIGLLMIAGCQQLYLFIRAYLDGRDLMRHVSELINAFVLLLFLPALVMIGGFFLQGPPPQGAFVFHFGAPSPGQERVLATSHHATLTTMSQAYERASTQKMRLTIDSEGQSTYTLRWECEITSKCEDAISALFPPVPAQQDVTFVEIPFLIDIAPDAEQGYYDAKIVVLREDGSIYDRIPLSLYVR